MNSIAIRSHVHPSSWQVQEAKNRFSEVIEQALANGPQVITRHGKPVVHVVSVANSAAHAPPANDGFVDYLLSASSLASEEFELPIAPRRSRKVPVQLGG